MECSLGILLGELCHKCDYQPFSKDIYEVSDLTECEQLLLESRLSSKLETICNYHKIKYLNKYHHLFGRNCSDPLSVHKKPVRNGLREIRLEHLNKPQNVPVDLIPGKSLCPTCNKKIFGAVSEEQQNDVDKDFQPETDTEKSAIGECTSLNVVDTLCESLNLSPASKIIKLSKNKRQTALKTKTEKIHSAVKRKLASSFNECLTDGEERNEEGEVNLSSNYKKLIEQLKDKCKLATKEDKIKIISLLPESWSRQKVFEELENVTNYQIRLSRSLMKTQGVLPELKKNRGNKLSDEVVTDVIKFYEEDENSRLCPGKKECVSLGNKVYKQKRLIMYSLNELFVSFKQKYPNHKVGRSAFCSLRPKWCVLPGAAGTHTVCVCKYHQNVKLMVSGAKLNIDYKDLIDLLVCDSQNSDCMLNNCQDCPGKEFLLELLRTETEDLPDEITFMQWVSTDRAELITRVMPLDDFFEDLVDKLLSLKKHHFISKAQSKYLSELKENLSTNVCVALCDFAENFTFIIQDEIQSFHWSNPQATLHPYVFYYKQNGDDRIYCKSLCVISDSLDHNTATVHTFQKYFVEEVKKVAPEVKKIIYFSDGASSQYKNKKNFSNICYHKNDFDIEVEWNFFASSHGKNACDGIGGSTKRAVTRASLQRPYSDQILTPEDMYKFCCDNISGINFIYVTSEEVQLNTMQLQKRFDSCTAIPQTRSYHKFVPLSQTQIRCYVYSQSEKFTDCSTSKLPDQNIFLFQKNDIVACIYDGEWWIGKVEETAEETNDLFIHFFHPHGPRTSFQASKNDKVWVPISKILRKLSPTEFTTATGRSFNISEKLCTTISEIFMMMLS